MAKYMSQGTTLAIGAAVGNQASLPVPGSDTFTVIGQVESISGPSLEKSNVDVTDLASTAKEFLSDLPEPGSLDFSIFLDGGDTMHQTLFADAAAQARFRNVQITLNDGGTTPTVFDMVAEVLSFSPGLEIGSAQKADLSMQVSGAVTPTWRT